MNDQLKARSNNKCELCGSTNELEQHLLDKGGSSEPDNSVVLCEKCKEEALSDSALDANHFRCLNDSMWSEHIPVQIMVYRVLTLLRDEAWAIDLKSQMYLDEESIAIAEAGVMNSNSGGESPPKDSNGADLNDGDSVTLIKDLVVRGANFTAKRGTMVRNISLSDNPEHIEGKVNGTRIVLVTKFLKKVND